MSHSIQYFNRIIKSFGWPAAFFLFKSKFKKNKLENISIKGITSKITLSNYACDVATLFKIFYAREYDIELKEQPKFIIDCGANIGLSAVFFANKYPGALVVAVEPDKQNFQFLERNTENCKNVVCINKAIWSSNVAMKVIDEGMGNWGIQTVIADKDDNDFIPGISLKEILDNYNQEKIDLLKIDIEGAEQELFSVNYQPWLQKTKVIAIELHDSPNDIIRETFYKAVRHFPSNQYCKGENLICDFS